MAGKKLIRAVIAAHLCDKTWWAIIALAWGAVILLAV